mmetsp:Transcript_86039/g.219228  ORF Transcript_86039/g.219228 Transcript_86039/m.219228 type:complete len:217 (-) Transcript_86039:34-684(-)
MLAGLAVQELLGEALALGIDLQALVLQVLSSGLDGHELALPAILQEPHLRVQVCLLPRQSSPSVIDGGEGISDLDLLLVGLHRSRREVRFSGREALQLLPEFHLSSLDGLHLQLHLFGDLLERVRFGRGQLLFQLLPRLLHLFLASFKLPLEVLRALPDSSLLVLQSGFQLAQLRLLRDHGRVPSAEACLSLLQGGGSLLHVHLLRSDLLLPRVEP